MSEHVIRLGSARRGLEEAALAYASAKTPDDRERLLERLVTASDVFARASADFDHVVHYDPKPERPWPAGG